MGLPKQCCCFTLETGVYVIGIFSLVTSSLSLVGNIVEEAHRAPEQTTHAWEIGNSVVNILAAIFLLVGVVKKRRAFLVAYIILEGLGLFMLTIFELLLVTALVFLAGPFADRFREKSDLSPEQIHQAVVAGSISAVIFAFLLALSTYFWLVIISYYKKLGTMDESSQAGWPSRNDEQSRLETGKYEPLAPPRDL